MDWKTFLKILKCLWILTNAYHHISASATESDLGKTNSRSSSSFTYPGDIFIGLFIDLHKSSSTSINQTCGELNPSAVQQLWSAIWAVDTINNQTEADMPKLGIKVYDTCDNPLVALHHTMTFLRQTLDDFPSSCQHQALIPMLGVVAVGEARVLQPTLGLLEVYSVPMVLATPSAASGLPAQSNVLTTAPTMASLVRAILALLTELRWTSIYTLSSSPAAIQDLMTSAASRGISVAQAITMTSGANILDTIEGLQETKKDGNPKVFILMLEPNEINGLVKIIGERSLHNIIWLVATPSLDKEWAAVWGRVLKMGFIVTPHPVYLQEFRASFLGALAGRAKGKPLAIDQYLQKVYDCVVDGGQNNNNTVNNNSSNSILCSTLTFEDLRKGFQQDPNVPSVSKAVSALAAALRMLQIDRCTLGTRCIQTGFKGPIFKDIMSALMKLSFTIQGNEPIEVEGTRMKFTEDGKLLFKHFDVYTFNSSSYPVQVGWYSDNIGLNLNIAWKQYSGGTRLYHTLSELEVSEASEDDSISKKGLGPSSGRPLVNVLHFSSATFVGRGWATAVIVVAGIGILMTAYIFLYVLVKICDRTLTGNQFLGIFLLLSVIALYSTCMLFVMPPSEGLCNWRLFLHSVSYALCYGVLFVKVMQLRSLVSLGLGGRLSHLNQAFTLFFIVGVQVAINIQWSVLTRPVFGVSQLGEPHCLISKRDFVCLQIYVFLLLLLTCGYALYTRHIRRNHNEGRWVLVASLLSVPIWVSWVFAFITLPEEYRDPIVCLGLIVAATVVVCTIFLPKMKTLSVQKRMGKKHKEFSTANSAATIFSLTHDLDAFSNGKAKTLPSSLIADSLLRSPVYDFREKRLSHLIMENGGDKRLHENSIEK